MTGPVTDTGGLSDATGASVSVVMDSIGGAMTSTLGVVALPLMIAGTVLALVLVVVLGRKVGSELREHRRQPDPRLRFDPDAPDVLGVWS